MQTPEAAKMNFIQMLDWAKDIAMGVNYLHHEAPYKVIHRDLKSKNVVISGEDYKLKLCDFGASRYLTQTGTGKNQNSLFQINYIFILKF